MNPTHNHPEDTINHPNTPPTDTIIHHLSELIAMRTYSDDTVANTLALDWIETQLTGLPVTIQRFEKNGHPSLIATSTAVEDYHNPRLWLAAHIDIVPGDESVFIPKIVDGKLIGRGAFDMKYAVALFITLFQQYGQRLDSMDIGLMITSDEEVAGENGVGWLVSDGYRGHAVLLPECGKSWTLESGAKGVTWWDIVSTGRPGHASRPWEGDNAIHTLSQFIQRVHEQFVSEPCGSDDHTHSTVNAGLIQGGTVANQIPELATARLDIRLTPGTSISDIRTILERCAHQLPGISITQQLAIEPYELLRDESTILFTSIVAKHTGHTPLRILSHGASDARFFARHTIPVISMPPTGGGQHSAHEWVEVESLATYYTILTKFVDQWLKP